jgi:hypothetical protein
VLAFAPYYRPGYADVADYVLFASAALAASTALLALAIWRLRPVVVAQAGRSEKRARARFPEPKRFFRSWPTPTLDGNPVVWREWYRNRPSRPARWIWTILLLAAWGLAALGTHDTIVYGVADGSAALAIGFMLTLFFGLLFVCATAPTVLAEERALGCLDALLASPLSTRSIVVGKWWGVYRRVLALFPFFAYQALFLTAATPDMTPAPTGVRWATPAPLTVSDRLVAGVLTPADFLVSGALLVSMGVVLATWIRRMSRAVACSVIIYLVVGMGWPILVQLSFGWWLVRGLTAEQWEATRWFINCLSALSPIQGPIEMLNSLEWYRTVSPWRGIGLGGVVAVKAMTAWVLLELAIRTFDRRLGRVPEAGVMPQSNSPQTRGDWKSAGFGLALGGTASRAKAS